MRRTLAALALTGALTGCASGTDEPLHIDLQGVASHLGCPTVQFDQKSAWEYGVDGQGRCRFHGDLVNLRAFRNNEQRDNWLVLVDKFRAHYCLDNGLILYGEKVETADVIANRLGCRVLRND